MISGLNIIFSGFIPALVRFLDDWEPGELDSEAKYQDSLYQFLHDKLPGYIIRKNYAEAGAIVDVYLKRKSFWGDDEVLFELKYDLADKTEFNRLVGQLMDMEPRKRKMIVILCGKTERSIPQRLKEHFKDYLNDDYSVLEVGDVEPHMAIILK